MTKRMVTDQYVEIEEYQYFDVNLREQFDYVYLDTACCETAHGVMLTKHHPLNADLLLDDLLYEQRQHRVDEEIENLRKMQIISLCEVMLAWKENNPEKRGTVYFSPANRFMTLNVKSRPVYVFGIGNIAEGRMSLLSECNYLIN